MIHMTLGLCREIALAGVICLAIGSWCSGADARAGAEKPPLTAREIVQRSHDLLRDDESYARVEMTIVRPRWTRTLVMDAWTQGTDRSLIRVLEPKKDRGVSFLKRDREGWQYVPSIDRVIKIPPSMMLQSWMGSDFTNDDIVRADSIITDYDHAIKREFSNGDDAYWLIEAKAKDGAPVVWGSIVFTVRKDNLVATRIEYFDERGVLVKHAVTSDVKRIEGREVATRFKMIDDSDSEHFTVVKYRDLTFSPDLSSSMFSLRELRR